MIFGRKSQKNSQLEKTSLASRADKFQLYMDSVQNPDFEVDFIMKAYTKEFKLPPTHLREDFSGTSVISYHWIKLNDKNHAVAVDNDSKPLKWCEINFLNKLESSERQRIRFIEGDVKEDDKKRVDTICALNFSYWIFKKRQDLKDYFKAAYKNLKSKGLLVIDVMGGSNCWLGSQEDVVHRENFDYVWETKKFDAITQNCDFAIHFKFRDGSVINNAFTYSWRFWTIAELKDLLDEVGFDRIDVYWEEVDEKSKVGTGTFKKRKSALPAGTWVAYLVGVKNREVNKASSLK
jgi:SAM-dependent methyltransferase